MAEPDLSKIVNLIMQNPKLIEEIKNLGANEEKEAEAESPLPEETQAEEEKAAAESEMTSGEASERVGKIRRRELLAALKPYVSEERSRAIDSMMSIADILDMMRSK